MFSEKLLFNSTDNYRNFLVCRGYCVASHNSAYCCLMKCQFHFPLITNENKNDLIGILDRLCFTYQHVDCFYTLIKYTFIDTKFVKNGEILDFVERIVSFNRLSNGLDKTPSFADKRLLCKKFRKHSLTSTQ